MKISYSLNGLLVAAAMPLSLAVPVPVAAQDAQPLQRSDFILQMDAEFSRLDRDASGVVTKDEITAVQLDAAMKEALRQNRMVFSALDKDGSGAIEPQEFALLANPAAIAVDAAPLAAMLDGNSDGAITLIEYRMATQANFDRADADRDGVITRVEMRAAGIAR